MGKKNKKEKKSKKVAVLKPENMTIYEAMEVQATFLETLEKYKKIKVDLSDVDEFDSAGLQLMVALKNDAQKQDKSVVFTQISSEVIALLNLFDMTQYFADSLVIEE